MDPRQARTLPELFRSSLETYDKPAALRTKRGGEYVDISSRDLLRQAENLAFGLLALGIQPGERVALLAENRPAWILTDQAILSVGALTVPVYPTLPAEQVRYILQNAGVRICFVSTRQQLEKVLSTQSETEISRVVTMDPMHHEATAVLSLAQVSALGEKKREASPDLLRERLAAIDPAGPATILYTSGTTGQPKGVVLSHDNILSNVKASVALLELGPRDTCLSFLPLSHIFERMAGYYAMLYAGVTIAYAESVDMVAQNMREIRPTIMMSVPRLYEKIYARVLEAALEGSALRRRLFVWAREVGERTVAKRMAGEPLGPGLAAQHAVADRLVFAKLRARTGGRLRFFCSGGAPLSPKIAKFFWAAGMPILEGYGLTETAPIIAMNTFDAARLGSVGKPVPGVEVRTAEDGEILCRGPNVMLGYYKMPEETAAAIVEGWFRTGDIGHLDGDGFLVITDRKKDLIKTSGGKYVAPQPIESQLKLSNLVSQAVLVGNRRKYASALIVPNFDNLRKHADRHAIRFADEEELVAVPAIRRLYDDLVADLNKGLSDFERIKRFALLTRDFTIDSGELTPTLKVKRGVVEKRYVDLIDSLYAEKLQV